MADMQGSPSRPLEVVIDSGNDIPKEWGDIVLLRKAQEVTIREVKESGETFELDWGTLNAEQEIDYIIQVNGKDQYPIKQVEFSQTYVEKEQGSGLYVKEALTKVVPIPKGVEVTLNTKEGKETAKSPDAIAIGVSNEVYAFPLGKHIEGENPAFIQIGKEKR